MDKSLKIEFMEENKLQVSLRRAVLRRARRRFSSKSSGITLLSRLSGRRKRRRLL